MADKPAFRVVQERTIPVTTYRIEREVVCETDDWVEAERAHMDLHRKPGAYKQGRPRLEGTHPSHDFQPVDLSTKPAGWKSGGDDQCVNCGAIDNGSYGSHAPCGYDFEGRPLIVEIERLEASRV